MFESKVGTIFRNFGMKDVIVDHIWYNSITDMWYGELIDGEYDGVFYRKIKFRFSKDIEYGRFDLFEPDSLYINRLNVDIPKEIMIQLFNVFK